LNKREEKARRKDNASFEAQDKEAQSTLRFAERDRQKEKA
jgi:hypothetical protein